MSRVGGKSELGTISTDVWHGGFCTAGGTLVKEVLENLSRAVNEGRSEKMARGMGV
jgi:hypothetical protein